MNYLAYPYVLALLILPFILRELMPRIKGMHGDALRVPFIQDIKNVNIQSGNFWGLKLGEKTGSMIKILLLYIIWALLVFAAARPQLVGEPIRIKTYSRNILMVMDISPSMTAEDFKLGGVSISRLEAVKKVASQFIDKRVNDRIGLVLFGSNAYLQAPLTYDRASVKEILMSMDAGMAGDATAIGDALALGLKSLRDSKTTPQKEVIILLTDGEMNAGKLSIPEVLNLARNEDVRVYTIGVSSDSFLTSIFGIAGMSDEIDEKTLKLIADETKGNYFRAKDTASLAQIYNEIDRLEPSANEDNFIRETKDLFHIPLALAVLFSVVLIWTARRDYNG